MSRILPIVLLGAGLLSGFLSKKAKPGLFWFPCGIRA
jgi:hypothetical protein